MEIKDRIKQLRKAKGLTQFEFADKLKVSRSNIASYETGKNELSSAVISLICRTFSVSETWLRTGEGEMFSDTAREEEIAAFMGDTLAADPEDFRKRFIAMLASLSIEEWKFIEEKAKELFAKERKKKQGYLVSPPKLKKQNLTKGLKLKVRALPPSAFSSVVYNTKKS